MIEHGTAGDCLYIVTEGTLCAVIESDDGTQRRLRRFGAGALVGEVAFFERSTRTASVVALTDCTLMRLDRTRYESMRSEAPSLAMALHDRVMAGQAARVRSLTRELDRALGP